MKNSVMLGTSIGPGKQYAEPIIARTITSFQDSVSEVVYVSDGLEDIEQATVKLPEPKEELDRIQRISRVRAKIRSIFLKSDCTHLFFLDADVIPPENVVSRLLAHEAAIVVGIYPLRDFAHAYMPAMTKTGSGGVIYGASHVTLRAQGFGMGCMLVAREVLERTKFRSGEGLAKLGEDYGFCVDSGEEVIIDPTVSCWHVHSDGLAGRFKVEDAKIGVMWEGSARYAHNKYGRWERGVPRYDLLPEKVRKLGPEFKSTEYTPVKVETREYADIVSQGE